jgi:hypothetical protein
VAELVVWPVICPKGPQFENGRGYQRVIFLNYLSRLLLTTSFKSQSFGPFTKFLL